MPAPEAQCNAAEQDDLLWRHLKTVPAFRALLRAVEARFYRHLHIPDPVLDLGCGDGHFARMAFDRPLDVGADPWWGPLNKARRAGAYRLNVQALGNALPFADETFASVISNSVLEHIPDVQSVLDETARVLRPGGRLVITMPSHLFTEELGGAHLLKPLGLADAYRRFFNRISRHAHTDPPQVWAGRLAQAGFTVERWQYYFSKEALRALELGHLQGLPSALLHFLTGHWIVAPWRDNLRYTDRWVRPYYEEEPPETGAYLFIVARREASPALSPDVVEVRLPHPHPLPTSEPLPLRSAGADTRSEAAEPPGGPPDETVFTFSARDADTLEEEPATGVSLTSRGFVAGTLLLAGLLAAFIGQTTLSRRPPTVGGGLAWYAFSFLSFGAALMLLRWPLELRTLAARLSRHTLLYPVALLLALLAQRQSGAITTAGNPVLAFALWFAAIITAAFALRPPGAAAPDEGTPIAEMPNVGDSGAKATTLFMARAVPYAKALLPVGLFLLALLPRIISIGSHPFILNGIEASIGLDALAVLQGQIRNPFATSWLTNPTLPLYPTSLPLALLGRNAVAIRLLSALVGASTVPLLFLFTRRLWSLGVALAASLFLAGYHLHVHYSRLGMTNVWDPLVALLMFGLIGIAARYPIRRNWLAAGVAIGLAAYFYTPSHLLPFFLVALVAYFLLFQRAFVVNNGSHILAAAAIAIVVALPQILFYGAHPGVFMERANSLGVFQSGWLVQQASAGQSALDILAGQFRRALLAFNGSLDTSTSYNPGIPLLSVWPSIFFVLGAGVALWRFRQVRYALLLIWLLVTLVFGGALLIDAPDSHRLLIAVPAVVLLTSTGLVWFVRQIHSVASTVSGSTSSVKRRLGLHPRLLAVLIIVLLFVAGDLFFYFGEYRNAHRFGDRNSEVAFEIGQYLDSLEGEWQAYFYGPPAMYVSFPTILYLASEFRPGENLFDVTTDLQALPPTPSGANLVFLYLPERSGEVNQTSQQYPQGDFLTFDGVLANPLFYAYEVRR